MPDNLSLELKRHLITYLSEFVFDDRLRKLEDIAAQRTRFITVVLENIYQSHNASAVLRSCDCFGVQDVYTVETFNKLDISKGVTKNAHKWLTIHRFKNPEANNLMACYEQLRTKGYKIAATTPHDSSMPLSELPIDKPVALVFGAEKTGLTDTAIGLADYKVHIPMSGFSESLNLSVSVALSLYETTNRLKSTLQNDIWSLSLDERTALVFDWLRKSVRSSDKLIRKYLNEIFPK
jgi:tRNA (guanosine-2'-O-)-methyltransferase